MMMVLPKPRFLEFFAGGGMARLGLAPYFECVFSNDNDPGKCAVYRKNFSAHHLSSADIAALNVVDIPPADLVWASFPCQDVSLAGTRRGLGAARSGTFWAFWSLMKALQDEGRCPPVLVLENVPGLLSSDQGRDFAALICALQQGGFRVGGVVLDAAHFVPQSRRRLFLVAVRGLLPEHLHQSEPMGADPRLVAAVGALPPAAQANWIWWSLPSTTATSARLCDVLEGAPPGEVWRRADELRHLLSLMTPAHRAKVEALRAEPGRGAAPVYRRIRGGQQRAEVRLDGRAGCLRTLKGGSSRALLLISDHGDLALRPLLPREGARLMGLPETYWLPEKVTPAFNLLGDGLCVPQVTWLARHLLTPLARAQILEVRSRPAPVSVPRAVKFPQSPITSV